MMPRSYALTFIGALLLVGTFSGAGAQTFRAPMLAGAASGTEYVTFWSGDLRIFAQQAGTQVEMIDIDTGLALSMGDPRIESTNVGTNPFILPSAGDSFEGIGGRGPSTEEIRVRIEASDPVIVWTGALSGATRHPGSPPDPSRGNPWGSYIPAFSETALSNGSELGKEFLGFTTLQLHIIALKEAGNPTSITVDDLVTNTDSDSDDSFVLSSGDAVFADSEIEVFELDGFEDDTVRVTSNVNASVLAGFALSTRPDWTVTPPSYAAGDDGSELGTLFYAFVQRSLTVFPTEDNTTLIITDLSDGDDSVTIFFADGDTSGDYQLYTPTLASDASGDIIPRGAAPAVDIIDNSGNPFDSDYVKVESDKPVLVYVGPVGSNTREFADVAFSVSTGPDSGIIYCFAQNAGGSNDLQVFGFDPDTEVNITSLSFTANFRGTGHHDFAFGPGVGGSTGWLEGVALPDTEVWWGSGLWNAEMLRIESNGPITVINGDYDNPLYGAFIPFVLATPTLPPVAVATVFPDSICPGETVTLDGSQSFDQDTVVGGQPLRWVWDFDTADDSDGDGIPDNDEDATGAVVTATYLTAGQHTAQLTFFDDEGESDTDFVTVTVESQGCVCPHSQGFWKNHEDQWPVSGLVLGAESYVQAELLALLRTPVRGDASLILAKQLIAAKLNIENGADPNPGDAAVASGDSLFGAFPGKLPYGVHPSTAEGHSMTKDGGVLDDYNNKAFTPDCVEILPIQPLKSSGGGSGGGGCALGASPMPPADIAGTLLPFLLLTGGLMIRRLRRRPGMAASS